MIAALDRAANRDGHPTNPEAKCPYLVAAQYDVPERTVVQVVNMYAHDDDRGNVIPMQMAANEDRVSV